MTVEAGAVTVEAGAVTVEAGAVLAEAVFVTVEAGAVTTYQSVLILTFKAWKKHTSNSARSHRDFTQYISISPIISNFFQEYIPVVGFPLAVLVDTIVNGTTVVLTEVFVTVVASTSVSVDAFAVWVFVTFCTFVFVTFLVSVLVAVTVSVAVETVVNV